ncbi:AT-rich interactive domain-containing protein 4B-like [Elysia marginata]|uniref:AT-rich interactive domain-containing protein 4B-like n=1 Tax=Elysia marginata TaxID=1093978 RepID=A0AAV4IHX1_9GAST|nr:AT-rich interactive domain-containing protein 4B-like [Elysia marginata]
MLGSDIEDDDDDNAEDEYASEDEPFEEKDRFVAQLYKFMDDRGTPINKAPCIGNKDLNLYRLFKIVQHLGGYNKVTKEMKWPLVYSKMGLPSLHLNPAHQIRAAYKKYLDAYETFFRKLGSTMGTLSRPGRARHNSGRSILSFRARERSPRSPKPPEKNKEDQAETVIAKGSSDKIDDPVDSSSVTSTEESDIITRRTPRRDARTPLIREESKERKEEHLTKPKKEEKKEEVTSTKVKKDEVMSKTKKEEATPVTKGKKTDLIKVKKDEDIFKKDERKSARKGKAGEDAKEVDKEDKKPVRSVKKDKEEDKTEDALEEVAPTPNSPKKRITRRKLLAPESAKEPVVKVEGETMKKMLVKEQKVVEKKEKEIPRTLERRDSRATEKKISEKKESVSKAVDKKESASVEKKIKVVEEKKKKEKKIKDDGDGGSDDGDDIEADLDKPEPKVNYPIGSKLRVKYGKGKNQKIYIAKVVELGRDAGHKTYRVHYAGWNSRYDEWIRPDRVVSVLDRPEISKFSKLTSLGKQGSSVTSSAKKVTTPPKTPAKSQDIFRTPKLVSSKTRATRSSSTENVAGTSLKRTGLQKRMTRRGSTVTDSTGSKSPESQGSSDAEENAGSVEDDESTKDDKEGDGDDEGLDVDIEEGSRNGAAADRIETPVLDVYKEDESTTKESSISELGSERTDEDDTEEFGENGDKSKISKACVEPDYSCSTSEEVSADIVDQPLQEVDAKQENEMPIIAKPVKSTVSVTEVKQAVDEIIVSVPHDKIDASNIENDGNDQEVSENISSDTSNKGDNVDMKSEALVERDNPEVCEGGKEDSVTFTSTMDVAGPSSVQEIETEGIVPASHSIPHLVKEVVEVSAEEKPTIKSGRGRKKDPLKDSSKKSIRTLDMTRTSSASSAAEIPMLEPMEPQMQPVDQERQQKESSPYDFEDVESPWKPEVTKKWEPTVSSTSTCAETIVPSDQKALKTVALEATEDEEREKKKVKKKGKKKPISPEFIDEIKPEEASSAIEQQPLKSTAPAAGEEPVEDVVSEKIGPRKKGRKKKDGGGEAKKDVIDQYENTVNSVVEAVKHSLQGADSDQEQRTTVKRRRPKRVSESDSKDVTKSAKLMRKFGTRKATKASELVEANKTTDEPSKALAPESTSALSTLAEGEAVTNKKSSREPSFCESQGFEPHSEPPDGSAGFDNTPPTTPEHDDASSGAIEKHFEKGESSSHTQHHSAPSVSEPHKQKDLSKTVCPSSSATSSLTLSVSSTTIVSSQVQSSTKSSSESPSDNDVISTASTDNLDSGVTNQQSESSGTDQDTQDPHNGTGRKRRQPSEGPSPAVTAQPKKKKRVHGTRSRTAKKSPKYIGNSDSQGSASNTPNHYPPESPPTKFVDVSKSPRPSKYNFNADLGEYLEGEARCNFLIAKMKEIKTIYMNLKSEVATIDRRRKRAKRKEKDGAQVSNEKDNAT